MSLRSIIPCIPEPNHRRLVNDCWASKTAKDPDSNALGKLVFYTQSRPVKLAKVSKVLVQYSKTDKYQLVTLAIVRKLLEECKNEVNVFGECYEYGKMGCPQDSALSIHYYNIAAQQNHREACFALTAWYLVGSPGVLPQSDTEAYLWAKKAAEQGLAKAEYAVGYFTEVGIGTVRDEREAVSWFRRAAEHGDKRAVTRLRTLGDVAMYSSAPNSPTKGKRSVNEPVGGGSRMSVMGLGGKKNSTASNHRPRRSTMSGISSAGSNTNGKKTDGDCLIM